ncbi:MAG: DUF6629 family protein [Bacteroidota bacterium]
MCFSAGASFGASAVLSVVGVLTLKKVEKKQQYLFAAIPIIFAIQQFTEGFVWLSISNADFAFLHRASVHLFLIFAQVLWPVWIPISVLLLEQKRKQKIALYALTFWGTIVSCVLAFYLTNNNPVAQIDSCHIQYLLVAPLSDFRFSGMFYFIPTVIPLFISGIKKLWVFGVATVVSYLVTQLFYVEYSLSVWCFFAAVLSVIIYYLMGIIKDGEHSEKMREWYKN